MQIQMHSRRCCACRDLAGTIRHTNSHKKRKRELFSLNFFFRTNHTAQLYSLFFISVDSSAFFVRFILPRRWCKNLMNCAVWYYYPLARIFWLNFILLLQQHILFASLLLLIPQQHFRLTLITITIDLFASLVSQLLEVSSFPYTSA